MASPIRQVVCLDKLMPRSGHGFTELAAGLLLGPTGWVWLALGLFIIPAVISVHRRPIRIPDLLTGAETVPKSRWALAI